MGTMLTDDANLHGLLDESDTKKLVISKMIHKAIIEIDEQGAEASGSTGKIFRRYSFKPLKLPGDEDS